MYKFIDYHHFSNIHLHKNFIEKPFRKSNVKIIASIFRNQIHGFLIKMNLNRGVTHYISITSGMPGTRVSAGLVNEMVVWHETELV